jgi:hypothetical protein
LVESGKFNKSSIKSGIKASNNPMLTSTSPLQSVQSDVLSTRKYTS